MSMHTARNIYKRDLVKGHNLDRWHLVVGEKNIAFSVALGLYHTVNPLIVAQAFICLQCSWHQAFIERRHV